MGGGGSIRQKVFIREGCLIQTQIHRGGLK